MNIIKEMLDITYLFFNECNDVYINTLEQENDNIQKEINYFKKEMIN
ncbi:MAG: hypothetical protein RSB67_03835 [Clostridia bacterium]